MNIYKPIEIASLVTALVFMLMFDGLNQAYAQSDLQNHSGLHAEQEDQSHEHRDELEDNDDHWPHDASDSHADHSEQGEHAHSDHADRDDEHSHDGHTDHDEEAIRISPETLLEFGIVIETASVDSLGMDLQLPGEVVFNADRVAHVMPSVSGITQSVAYSVGERVQAGEVMATLSSRDLAEARSTYLATKARLELAREIFNRDEKLVTDRIGTERQMLESQQALREAEIALRLAEQNLHAIGESHESLKVLQNIEDTALAEYKMRAPIDGIVIERHLTRGELVSEQTAYPPFVIADISSVWVDLTVYQRDIANLNSGQTVRITFGHGIPDASGTIAFISSSFEEQTRTATARVILDNPQGHWRPGLFVTAHLSTEQLSESVVVPRSAVTQLEGQTVVFVQEGDIFEQRRVHLGNASEDKVEILSGLEPGERYVARNVLALKAEFNRTELEHAGHVH